MASATVIGSGHRDGAHRIGGLGQQITYGFNIDFYTPIIVGLVLSVLLAAVCDLLLVGMERLLVPWKRREEGGEGLMAIWTHFRHFIAGVFGWLTTSANWHGSSGIPQLLWHQTELSICVVIGAALIGGGVGLILGHSGHGGLVAVNIANAARAVPTLALLTLFAIIPSISLRYDGFLASFLALVVLAIPPVLTNTYVGVRGVDAEVARRRKGDGSHWG